MSHDDEKIAMGTTYPRNDIVKLRDCPPWTVSSYIYYFPDGVQYGAQQITDAHRYDEFHKPHFIILNLAVGGVWPGYPDQYTVFPQNYYIDYVRVYQ